MPAALSHGNINKSDDVDSATTAIPTILIAFLPPHAWSVNLRCREKSLTYDTMAECVKKCQYAVRGEIYLAATERIKSGKEVIFTNVGNPHGLGQKPLTFLRQVRCQKATPRVLGFMYPLRSV